MDYKTKVNELIQLGERALKENCKPAETGMFVMNRISGELYLSWLNNTQLFAARELQDHPFADDMIRICKEKKGSISEAKKLLAYLKSILEDSEFFKGRIQHNEEGQKKEVVNKKVFIVHGHDEAARQSVARALEHDGFEVIVLLEQPNRGNTIIEKIVENSDVGYAVVLYTPCDEGRDCEKENEQLRKRARQNVVFEHGFLIGHLGREKVVALVKGDVETPGDISGVVYITMDDHDGWKLQLVKEMVAAGLPVDANKWV